MNDKIASFACDLCVLAGYMLVVSEELGQKHNMINLHPAPPDGPSGSRQAVIWALIQNKPDTAGAMMHLVTPELDKGPLVSYCLFPIRRQPFVEYWQKDDKNTLLRLLRQHEFARGFPLITLTLQSLSRGEISIRNGTVIDARGRAISGYNLPHQVDEEVKERL